MVIPNQQRSTTTKQEKVVVLFFRFFDNSLKNPDEDSGEIWDASCPQEIRGAVERWKEDSDFEDVEKPN